MQSVTNLSDKKSGQKQNNEVGPKPQIRKWLQMEQSGSGTWLKSIFMIVSK